MRKDLTEYEKLECAEFVLDILGKALRYGVHDMAAGEWILEAKDECAKLRGHYLKSEARLGL